MKKLFLLGAVFASLVVTGTAVAATISLTGPATITAGTAASFGGQLTGVGSPKTVSLSQFAGAGCAGAGNAAGSGLANAASSWTYNILYTAGAALAKTTISLQSSMSVNTAGGPVTKVSNCLDVNVLKAGGGQHHALVVQPSHAFLCYSKSQGAPTTSDGWTAAAAVGLMKQGYWQPYAVAGSDSSSDAVNVGKFHLACNPATAQSAGGSNGYVDNDGSQVDAQYAGMIGVYAVAGS